MRYSRRPRRRASRLAALIVLGLLSFGVNGLTASIVMPGSHHTADRTQAITVNTVKPTECNGITLVSIVVGNNGNAQANLLLGSGANNNMTGRGGTDCIIGGAGNDTINGGAGTDVCMGGLGADTYSNCETTYS